MADVSFTVAVGIRAPISPGEYAVRSRTINVSYPPAVNLGTAVVELPKSLSILFVVRWEDEAGQIAAQLTSSGYERHLPIYHALEAISELLLAYKLVRIGHADGRGLRTVGIGDTLLYFSSIAGKPTGDLNVGLKNYEGNNAWLGVATTPDPHGTTGLAAPHIGTLCFELLEHGFYSEAVIVAFSVLDDFVQELLHTPLEKKGLAAQSERNELLRTIKENRLKLYLGPILKLASGTDSEALWPASGHALTWLNTIRNRIAHSAEPIDYGSAARAIYACLRTLVALRDGGLPNVEIPVELFRHAKITAAWTQNPPSWVPTGELAESTDFRS
jgi:hypothetical protein